MPDSHNPFEWAVHAFLKRFGATMFVDDVKGNDWEDLRREVLDGLLISIPFYDQLLVEGSLPETHAFENEAFYASEENRYRCDSCGACRASPKLLRKHFAVDHGVKVFETKLSTGYEITFWTFLNGFNARQGESEYMHS